MEEEIPLPNVKLQTLKKVIEYCNMHRQDEPAEIEKPLKSANLYPIMIYNNKELMQELMQRMFNLFK